MIVDDSITARSVLAKVVASEEDMVVAATAGGAEVALTLLPRTPCDVILLDLEMPGMGGLEALPHLLKAAGSAAIIVVSTLAVAGAEPTVQALAMGAADALAKPRSGEFDDGYRRSLVTRIRVLGRRGAGRSMPGESQPTAISRPLPKPTGTVSARLDRLTFPLGILALGASTGGIHALSRFFSQKDVAREVPVLITQHLPIGFISVFAQQVETMAGRPTRVGEKGMPVEKGHIYVAPGDGHLLVRRKRDTLTIDIATHAVPSGCRPSVDPMLDSLAQAVGRAGVGVILSGMGRDGALGAQKLAAAGGTLLAQDEGSCAVFGMPRGIVDAGLQTFIAPPEELARIVSERGRVQQWN